MCGKPKMKIRAREFYTKEALAAYTFIGPSLIGFSVFFIIPFVGSLYYCFTRGIGGVEFVGLANFIDLFRSESFLLAFKNTLIFSGISVPLIIIVSFAIAVLLTQKIKGLSYFRTFYIIPLIIPTASVILVWKIIFDEFGIANNLLVRLNIDPNQWYEGKWSVIVLSLLYIWKNCGYNIILFIAGINSIPSAYYESARVDGAGKLRCMFGITIPLVLPTAFFVFIMSFINTFKVFKEAYLLAGSYPDPNAYLLQHFMNNNFFNLSYQRLSTSAFIVLLLVICLVFLMFRFENKYAQNIT